MKGGSLPMYDHSWKIKGAMISGVSLLCMIAERATRFIIFPEYDSAQHFALFKWAMLFGLLFVMFSKEKIEDDRTQAIRRKAYQIGFYMMVCILMASALNATLHPDEMIVDVNTLFFIAGLGILFYLVFFHIGLYFDFLWDYEDHSVMENLRLIPKHKWGKIVFLVAGAIILLLLELIY
jgi:hypothetical protein